MSTGKVEMICGGTCSGKTALALGRALQAAARKKNVIIIEFLKGSQKFDNTEVLERLEPEIKIFRFEKSDCYFEHLSEEEKREERVNIRNGLNYAKKVLTTGECDLLVLDEVLGTLDQGIIEREELKAILDCRDEAGVILTGQVLPEHPEELADRVEHVDVSVFSDGVSE
ncbi:cob(I)yrinic acid a,c-diamide adenosyltransferase [Brotaphodocola sp.]|uniref:cob(I)yrinic acid a,c-diamide adenosyltransferase n=1 Tax=Brotaphodocola sp. TaxID=3073577 RepID=UPI003D7EB61D